MSTPRSRWRAGPETVPRAPSFITAARSTPVERRHRQGEGGPVTIDTASAKPSTRRRRRFAQPRHAAGSEQAQRGHRAAGDQDADRAAE